MICFGVFSGRLFVCIKRCEHMHACMNAHVREPTCFPWSNLSCLHEVVGSVDVQLHVELSGARELKPSQQLPVCSTNDSQRVRVMVQIK